MPSAPTPPRSPRRCRDQCLDVQQLVARLGGLLELQVARMLLHLLFELLDLARQLLFRHVLVVRLLLGFGQFRLGALRVVDTVDDVLDALLHPCGTMPCASLLRHLLGTATLRLPDRARHRIGHLVAIEDGRSIDVTRRPPDRLNQ